ncbi:hypothetical protein ASD11_12885 [Aeromicrobium sp. Root495]|uniref:sigma-70 family RNA polymerase sigma factor n=1 Tax=Aeromicrobium sp. Root495 TaxID=1736550 RepID=UPI0006F97C3A|nr:sigma-70 family RNA polymerase sigma factor [Aeromicrobium sp. Root495]KQY60342.1 hypothetical protein ASD11_12885 [Aeromicrobium sp. Root495]
MSRAPLTTPDLTVEVISSRRPVQQDLDEAGTSLDAVGTLADLDDLMLLDLARAGSEGAFDELYRRYSYPALRLARHLGPAVEADDVVAETFAQVLDQVRRGRGPQTAFRAYLFTSVRHEVGRRLKQRARVRVTDELEELDGTATLHGGGLEGVEQELVRDALAQLPERWRLVLWRVEVEGLRPREVAEELGIRPNAVSALAYRARGALRQAYLDAHVTRTIDSLPAACRPVRVLLGGRARQSLTRRDRQVVDAHLDACSGCRGALAELRDVNRHLADAVPRTAAPAPVRPVAEAGPALDQQASVHPLGRDRHDQRCGCLEGRARIA